MKTLIINLTVEKLDNSFSMFLKKEEVEYVWQDGAPSIIHSPSRLLLKMSVEVLADHLKIYTKDIAPTEISGLHLIVVGGTEELIRWLTYLAGKWNMSLTLWIKYLGTYKEEILCSMDPDPFLDRVVDHQYLLATA